MKPNFSRPTERPVRAWEIWANPILLRYARSRLRGRHLISWGLVIGVLTIFVYFFAFTIASNRADLDVVRAARVTFLPLLLIQGILLMLLGTGAVAGGITQEADEGMIDYQRLTPMTPLSKIVGYLFGLPIREYLLALITVPFMVFSLILGDIQWAPVIKFYIVFSSTVLLYHMTGLVAGSVVKQRRLAGRASQMLVVTLYLILPRFSNFGFVFLAYLTIYPMLTEQSGPFWAHMTGRNFFQSQGATVSFYDWNFTPFAFSLFIQGSLIFVFAMILHRKWRRPNAHLLSKPFALILFTSLMVLLLGNALPLIDNGKILPGMRSNITSIGGFRNVEVWAMASVFGFALLALGIGVTGTITPTAEEMIKGLRRARKRNATRVSFWADEATSLWHMAAINLLATCTWLIFAKSLFSTVLSFNALSPFWTVILGVSLMVPLICFHAILERCGRRTVMLWMLFLWIVPVLMAIILGATSDRLQSVSVYLTGFSGLALPFYGTATLGVPPVDLEEAAPSLQRAFFVSFVFHLFASVVLLKQLWLWRAQQTNPLMNKETKAAPRPFL